MGKAPDKIVIAIDGHSSCGKSTLAKDLANKLSLLYIDSGAMYRAITLYAIENNMIKEKSLAIEPLKAVISSINIEFRHLDDSDAPVVFMNNRNVEPFIRSLKVSNYVSPISALDFVRKHLVDLQKKMGEKGGIVMDGRDIGTGVFPNADLKIFMTASVQVRAQRRFDEMKAKGEEVKFEDIIANVKNRDHIDSTRSISPLRRADDALLLDNSFLNRKEQLEFVLDRLRERGWDVDLEK